MLGTRALRLSQLSNYITMSINSTPTTSKQSNFPGTNQLDPQEYLTWNHEDLPKVHAPHSQFTLVNYTTNNSNHLARPQYPINISSILGIWGGGSLISPTDAELMGACRFTMEGDDSQHLRAFPEENPILAHYILSAWWLHLLNVLGHYVIRPGEIEQFMVMNNNIMTLGCTYSKFRINNPPDIIYKLTYIGRIITWTPSRLYCAPAL